MPLRRARTAVFREPQAHAAEEFVRLRFNLLRSGEKSPLGGREVARKVFHVELARSNQRPPKATSAVSKKEQALIAEKLKQAQRAEALAAVADVAAP